MNFLKGYADGDGSVYQRSSNGGGHRDTHLYITEGDLKRATELKSIFRRIFGRGYTYRPRRRNYWLINLSLNPDNALLLLENGFFSHFPKMQTRIAEKTMDSKVTGALLHLHDLFADKSFSTEDLARLSPGIRPWFVSTAVRQGYLRPVGVQTPTAGGAKWFRLYKLTERSLSLIKLISPFRSNVNQQRSSSSSRQTEPDNHRMSTLSQA